MCMWLKTRQRLSRRDRTILSSNAYRTGSKYWTTPKIGRVLTGLKIIPTSPNNSITEIQYLPPVRKYIYLQDCIIHTALCYKARSMPSTRSCNTNRKILELFYIWVPNCLRGTQHYVLCRNNGRNERPWWAGWYAAICVLAVHTIFRFWGFREKSHTHAF